MSEALFDERTKVCQECEGDGFTTEVLKQRDFRGYWAPIGKVKLVCDTCSGAGYVRVKVEAA